MVGEMTANREVALVEVEEEASAVFPRDCSPSRQRGICLGMRSRVETGE